MFRVIGKALLLVFIVALIGGNVYMVLKYQALQEVEAGLMKEIESLERRQRALKQKAAQEKAVAATLMRAKLAAEGQNRNLQGKIEELEKEKAQLLAAKDKGREQWQAEVAAKTAEIEKWEKRYEKINALAQELKEQVRGLNQEIAEKEDRIQTLRAEKAELASELRQETRTAERYLRHNRILGEVADELIERYRKKDFSDILKEKEPFTGIPQVEVEHMLQEYLDRVDRGTIQENRQALND